MACVLGGPLEVVCERDELGCALDVAFKEDDLADVVGGPDESFDVGARGGAVEADYEELLCRYIVLVSGRVSGF